MSDAKASAHGLKKLKTTIDQMFTNAVRRWPERNFVISDGRQITYSEMAKLVDEAAHGLQALGVQPGDRVAVWMSNIWEWAVIQFAVTRMGAVLTPLNTRLRVEDLRHTLHDSGARVLVTQASTHDFSYIDVVQAILADRASVPNLQHVVVARGADAQPAPFISWNAFVAGGRNDENPLRPAQEVRELAYILYTSGTTSLPKGVMLSHASLNNCFNLATDLRDGDVAFLVYPMFAITGCHNMVLALTLVGGCVVMQERFDAKEAVDLIETHRCTAIGCIVYVLEDLAKAPGFAPGRVSSLRAAYVFPRRPEHLELLHKFGLKSAGTGYGMTETGAHVTYASSLDPEALTTDGAPWPGNQIRIVTEDGREAKPGEEGALLVRTPHLMLGYFNRPDATAQAIDAEGWLHTGDVGRVDAHGRLTWVGRNSDMYKCSGFNVASQEVEAFLSRHPAVAEVAVLGVPDSGKGEVGAAYIVPKKGTSISYTDIRTFCAGQIASYKVPGHLFVREELPRTASGKVRKVELKASFLKGKSAAAD